MAAATDVNNLTYSQRQFITLYAIAKICLRNQETIEVLRAETNAFLGNNRAAGERLKILYWHLLRDRRYRKTFDELTSSSNDFMERLISRAALDLPAIVFE
jgi:predicted metallo-beta-lactamase superfamily hydrolase